ncbi:Histidine kinase-, DNA gyrase B-, and HSP90-like ATPase [Streptoalloteichus tenebrarius]|uniref:Histidine kinase-, DNA gyrase B-, and HSP90-like ATPase n=1 Tax=Streptoalloteichus tenebrarius (strain ATCC 17920 / DSM 40477 / JCM 4838 / CBS 697.72 / NBRC 16177 / NCIMB 11028 / NRRL B-12390 / A12253. 1 / ISP 5477) TaxID=1933 RepID=A0ABT1I0T3_STRSD|nr:DUF5931 domain-containing protein [Streptoalloteichus tenebrarius]MCP2261402.1 Histidine kinase-, DNA gyrase B-, and HSP90-like ATPase [Streptoalloteichus tenebrarius]BFF02005.1 DUF5931 domain-containing protein [Streptoalloteichus tenebrarius]
MQAGPSDAGKRIIKDNTTPLWRGAVTLRIVTYLFAVGVFSVHRDGYERPWLGWLEIAIVTVWTALTVFWFSRDNGRRRSLVIVDVTLTTALVAASHFVLSPEQLVQPAPLVPTIWASGCVVFAAVHGGRGAGAAAGAVVSVLSVWARGYFNTDMARDTVLLVGIGFVVGLASTTARHSGEQLERALRAEAATKERERLARAVHDSVLQVLARVRRRGAELGGEAAELARMAGEQEIALRSLVAAAPQESTVDGEVDLRPQLQLLTTPRFQVSVPATQVMLPAAVAAELSSVAREALSNVDKHAGGEARAWVLLEDLGDEVVLSVRDDGPGIPEGRLAAAETEGRMGVAHSIRGRVAELGGSLSLHTAPGEGTEWEVRVPRRRTRRKGVAR